MKLVRENSYSSDLFIKMLSNTKEGNDIAKIVFSKYIDRVGLVEGIHQFNQNLKLTIESKLDDIPSENLAIKPNQYSAKYSPDLSTPSKVKDSFKKYLDSSKGTFVDTLCDFNKYLIKAGIAERHNLLSKGNLKMFQLRRYDSFSKSSLSSHSQLSLHLGTIK